MARQNTQPVRFRRMPRTDQTVAMSSGRAGVVQMLGYIPVNRGDSLSGSVGIDLNLAEMPKPLLNGVVANVQAWFVPKSVLPQFPGPDEFMASWTGTKVKSLGPDGVTIERDPPAFFQTITDGADLSLVEASEMYRGLGLHLSTSSDLNTDLIDSFVTCYNFRLQAHSSKLPLHPFAKQDLTAATSWPAAFWPSGRLSRVVPDYEKALVVGALDLDVSAGLLPVSLSEHGGGVGASYNSVHRGDNKEAFFGTDSAPTLRLYAEMAGETVVTSLADIDKARQTQAFAKLRASMAGNKAGGFANDDAIIATLMQGLSVPVDQFHRPWLLDSARVPVGFSRRYATNSDALDESVSQGMASAVLSLNLPQQDTGGMIVYTVEVLPERIAERMSDEYQFITEVSGLPDALRDVQRPEPVDIVLNRRVDARHTDPDGVYGYEGMNDAWNRAYTRLGGAFYQEDPSNPWTEQRSALWMPGLIDPQYTRDHFLAPVPFPHDVFSDTQAPAFEVVTRHTVSIVGLTQIGDPLVEDNNEYADTKPEDDE